MKTVSSVRRPDPRDARQLDELRRAALLDIAHLGDSGELCLRALEAYGPWFPWRERFLTQRLRCLEENRHPDASRARHDLERFRAEMSFPLDSGLRPES